GPGAEPLRSDGGEGPEASESTGGLDRAGSARRRTAGAPSRPTNRMGGGRPLDAPADEERIVPVEQIVPEEPIVPEEKRAPEPSARGPRVRDEPRVRGEPRGG